MTEVLRSEKLLKSERRRANDSVSNIFSLLLYSLWYFIWGGGNFYKSREERKARKKTATTTRRRRRRRWWWDLTARDRSLNSFLPPLDSFHSFLFWHILKWPPISINGEKCYGTYWNIYKRVLSTVCPLSVACLLAFAQQFINLAKELLESRKSRVAFAIANDVINITR